MSELVDLVDPQGRIMKRGVARREIELGDGFHMQIVIVVVFNKHGQVLVHQRSYGKQVNPGAIDHICGGVVSGEAVIQAAEREALGETGIRPRNMRVIRTGLNSYGRYCYLLVGESDEAAGTGDPREVIWVGWRYPDELTESRAGGVADFVDGFFEDIVAVQAARQG